VNVLPYAILALCGGIAVALQGAANASLGSKIGLHSALFVSTSIVWLFCIGFYAVRGMGPLTAPGVSLAHYIGGFCGFLIITAAALAFPRIGPAAAIALFVAGQGVAAVVVEHYAWFGMTRVPFSMSRLIGVALVVIGAFLLRKQA
jgi:bacterial/archaeal transporter family-2 protein